MMKYIHGPNDWSIANAEIYKFRATVDNSTLAFASDSTEASETSETSETFSELEKEVEWLEIFAVVVVNCLLVLLGILAYRRMRKSRRKQELRPPTKDVEVELVAPVVCT